MSKKIILSICLFSLHTLFACASAGAAQSSSSANAPAPTASHRKVTTNALIFMMIKSQNHLHAKLGWLLNYFSTLAVEAYGPAIMQAQAEENIQKVEPAFAEFAQFLINIEEETDQLLQKYNITELQQNEDRLKQGTAGLQQYIDFVRANNSQASV